MTPVQKPATCLVRVGGVQAVRHRLGRHAPGPRQERESELGASLRQVAAALLLAEPHGLQAEARPRERDGAVDVARAHVALVLATGEVALAPHVGAVHLVGAARDEERRGVLARPPGVVVGHGRDGAVHLRHALGEQGAAVVLRVRLRAHVVPHAAEALQAVGGDAPPVTVDDELRVRLPLAVVPDDPDNHLASVHQ